jgi:hypothetical protein
MIRTCFLFGSAVLLLACAVGRSAAQPPVPGGPSPGVLAPQSRPSFAPYLNLTNRNVDPAVTYYGIVRPQITTNNAVQALQQQAAASAMQAAEKQPAVDPGLPVTGQPTYFLNTGGYFLNSRSGLVPLNATRTTRSPLSPSAPFNPPAPPRASPVR